MGRVTYSDEIADLICARLADGESLRTICKDENMPDRNSVFNWLMDTTKPEFSAKYARAREIQADTMIDDIPDIADDGSNDYMERFDKNGASMGYFENGESARRSALRISTRQWIAEKLKPKKYGAKLDVTANVTHNLSDMTDEDLAAIATGSGPRAAAKA